MKPKIYVINMKDAVKRREHILKICEPLKDLFDLEFIKAFNGKELKESFVKAYIDSDKMKKFYKKGLTRGEIGCMLSHLRCYKNIIKYKLPFAFILEDDVVLEEGFEKIFSNISEAFLQDSDPFKLKLELLLLSHYKQIYRDDGFFIPTPFSKRFKLDFAGRTLRRILGRGGNGASCYFITQKGALKISKLLKHPFMPVDVYICLEKYVNLYALFPSIGRTKDEFTKESSTQASLSVRKHSKLSKYFKKYKFALQYLLPSLKGLKKYE